MGGQDDSGLAGQLADQPAHVPGLGRIQAVGGFVQDQQAGLAQDRLGDPDPLFQAPGQGGDGGQQPRAQIGGAHHAPDLGAPGAAPQALETGGELEVVRHHHFRVHGQILGQVTQLALGLLGMRRQVQPGNTDSALIGLQVAAEHFHDRGFAGTVVPQQADDFPSTDGETDLVHGDELAVAAC